jgi:chromate transport protein ChrA
MQGFVRGLGLAVSSIFLVVVVQLLSDVGVDWRSLSLIGAAIALGLSNRLPIPVVLGLAALVGMVLY